MDDAGEGFASPMLYTCPHCGGEVEAAADGGELLGCPHCGGAFALPAENIATRAQENDHDQPQREAELDGLRIQQVVRGRRAAIRARSYCLIALLGCAVIAIQAAVMGVGHLRDRHFFRTAMYLVTAIALAIAAWHFLQKTIELGKEAAAQPPPDPQAPPDFTSLSDGSQHVRI